MQTGVLFSLLMVAVLCSLSQQESCQDQRSQAVRISVMSRRNQTGHQLTEVLVRQNTGEGVTPKRAPWIVNLEQGRARCPEQGTEYLLASIIVAPEPAADYELYPLVGRYKLHTTPRTWEQALNTCQQEGAHLAVINSDTEAKVLIKLFSKHPKIPGATLVDRAFMGFNDIVDAGKFVTIFGQSLKSAGYEKWDSGEPNNGGASASNPGQDCGVMIRNGLLDDLGCKALCPFFCEQEL